MRNVLITTDKRDISESLSGFLNEGSFIDRCQSIDQTIQKLKTKAYNILFLDLDRVVLEDGQKESTETYSAILSRFWIPQPTLKIVVITSRQRVRQAVMAVKAGANNFLTYPLNDDEIKLLVSDIYEERILQSELAHLRDEFWAKEAEEDISTLSPIMRTALDQIRTVAPTRSTVLLTGETGTGKSRLAKLIHAHSSRKKGPFISVNCGAIPDTLIESELFGHEKGAFTGAIKLKLGRFEIARGGTLFLDEIGTISPAAQIKLLTVIQDSEFQRVGGEHSIKADVRLIAATNTNLMDLVNEGGFRKDLYYRLNVFPITIPPLRNRYEDIPTLTQNLTEKLNRLNGKIIRGIQPQVLTSLKAYDWPGNIRELENILERAHILERSHILSEESFPQEIIQRQVPMKKLEIQFPATLSEVRSQAANEAEKAYLKELLSRNNGKIAISASEADISTRQLNKLLNKHQINKADYKPRVDGPRPPQG